MRDGGTGDHEDLGQGRGNRPDGSETRPRLAWRVATVVAAWMLLAGGGLASGRRPLRRAPVAHRRRATHVRVRARSVGGRNARTSVAGAAEARAGSASRSTPATTPAALPGAAAPPTFSAAFADGRLRLALPGPFAPGWHNVEIACSSEVGDVPLGSRVRRVKANRGILAVEERVAATPGVYHLQARVDGAGAGDAMLTVPGAEIDGGDFLINGSPLSGFFWTWRGLDWKSERDHGLFSNITVANLLKPVEAGGFGFNCIYTDCERLRPADFQALDASGGHLMAATTGWQGLNPWGPKEWNTGLQVDPIIRSDGTAASGGSFDSPRNRSNFVHDLQQFKKTFGSPRSLLGFYLFESTPDMPWDNRGEYTDYSPASQERFRKWLEARYHSLDAFNKAQGQRFHSFAQVIPPASPDDAAQRGFDPSFWNDWIDFRYWSMAEFLDWARHEVHAVFGANRLLCVTEGLTASYAGNDPNVTGSNSFYGIDERLRARNCDAIGVEGTYDYMPNHTRILRQATDFDGDGLPDVPVVMDFYNYSWQPKALYGEPADIPRLRQVDELGAGATGTIMEHTGTWIVAWDEGSQRITPDRVQGFRKLAAVNDLRARYPLLFAHALTPSDVAVVIPTAQLRYDPRYRQQARWWDEEAAGFQHALQRSQRMIRILYDDEPLPADARALMVPIGERTSDGFLQRLAAAVDAGAHVYIEGPATNDERGRDLGFPLEALVGAKLGAPEAGPIVLSDGIKLPCAQGYRLKDVRGGVLARFKDGSPAVATHPFGKGEVIYCPSLLASVAAEDAWHDALYELSFPEPYRVYSDAIAGSLARPLLSISGAASPKDIRVGLLQRRDTTLALLTNWNARPQSFTLHLPLTYTAAYDLRARRWLPLRIVATTEATLRIPGHDWAAVALGAQRARLQAALDAPPVNWKFLAP